MKIVSAEGNKQLRIITKIRKIYFSYKTEVKIKKNYNHSNAAGARIITIPVYSPFPISEDEGEVPV